VFRLRTSRRRSVCLALVLICLTAGSTLQSQSKSKETPQPDTPINETSFRLTLPGKWTPIPSNDPTLRTYHSTSEQLSVSIFGSLFGASSVMDHDAKVTTFKRWVAKIRTLESKAAEPAAVELTEPLFGESRGTLAARYTGYDRARKRRVHCMLLANSVAFEIFYYEGLDLSEHAAEDRAKAIFNSVDIPR